MQQAIRINISLSGDTLERLDQYAFENHSSRSKAITDLIWKAQVKNTQLRGQITLEELLRSQNGNKRSRKKTETI